MEEKKKKETKRINFSSGSWIVELYRLCVIVELNYNDDFLIYFGGNSSWFFGSENLAKIHWLEFMKKKKRKWLISLLRVELLNCIGYGVVVELNYMVSFNDGFLIHFKRTLMYCIKSFGRVCSVMLVW